MKNKPKKDKSDFVHAIIKSGLTFIPGPAAELFNQIIVPPIEKRRDEWIESIAMDLLKLQGKFDEIKNETLRSNDLFISIILNASQVAIRNHQIEKLDALKSAVLNSALKLSFEDDIALMFINFIDSLTPWHLRILKMLDNPRNYAKARNINFPNWSVGGVGTVIETAMPELKGKREFYDLIGQDLLSHGLLISANFHNTMTVDSMLGSHTTQFGKQFIDFIISPLGK